MIIPPSINPSTTINLNSIISTLFLFLSFPPSLLSSPPFLCPTAIFAFGDSLTDPGNQCAASPFCEAHFPPSGITYFHHPANRISDGRLLIDFIAQAFRFPLLNPYFENISPDFAHGVNFAFSGAQARSSLPTQINQYLYFKSRVLSLRTRKLGLPSSQQFSNALFFIYIGINDFLHGSPTGGPVRGSSSDLIVSQVVQSVSYAVQNLYNQGARTFMLVNVPPIGCLPLMLDNYGTKVTSDYDSSGCLIEYNTPIQAYNARLLVLIESLRQQLPEATLIHADCYQVYRQAVANPTTYGFERNQTLTPCRNAPGGPKLCSDPSHYISWDGLHYTEAFNGVMAISFLKGHGTDSHNNITDTCRLDFQAFQLP